MVSQNNPTKSPTNPTARIMPIIPVLILLVVIFAAFTIPFIYETQTLWYKTGIDKTMLQTAQVAGLLALILLMVQIILAIRAKILVKVYSMAKIVRLHRVNAILIVASSLIHLLLVLLPEGIDNLPIGKKYWPEMVGALLFLLILVNVAVSYLRTKLNLNYRRWKTVHQITGYLIPLLACIHVLFVSESFEQTVPKYLLLGMAIITYLWVVKVKIQSSTKSISANNK